MQFTQKKLPLEAVSKLRSCSIHSVNPFALMLAPVYVFMKRNEKFVSVKAPLDFFTAEELERLKPFELFFIPEFADSAIPFRDAGRKIRALLNLVTEPAREEIVQSPAEGSSDFPEVQLAPAPFEISDHVLQQVGPLWSESATIEPFFISVLVNEVCEVIPGDLLRSARDGSVDTYELAIFRSAWTVFLALHLGYCDARFLNDLRLRVFQKTLDGTILSSLPAAGDEVSELVLLSAASMRNAKLKILTADIFNGRPERVSQKVSSRMKRVKASLIVAGQVTPSIHGPGGFIQAEETAEDADV